MNVLQRVVLIAGFCGVLHSSIAPPVNQPMDTEVSRYNAFEERQLPFTRTFAVDYANVPGLLTEWGAAAGATGVLFVFFGLLNGPRRVVARAAPAPALPPGEGPPPGISRS